MTIPPSRHLRKRLAACVALAVMSLVGGSAGATEVWRPPQEASWQWQFSGSVDTTVRAEVYDIDMFDNGARIVRRLHSKGKKVICYISAGSYERWRPDAGRFPARAIPHQRMGGRALAGHPQTSRSSPDHEGSNG